MSITKFNPALREGDTVETEWSQVSYDFWCRKKAECFKSTKEIRIVNLHDVVRSVIEQDLSESERGVALMRWVEGLTAKQIADLTGTSIPNVYKTAARVNEKIRFVLKHIINSEEFRYEEDD